MTTNCSYGTWNNRVEHGGDTVDGTVIDALADAHFGATDTQAIIKAYREAVNAALPPSVSLAGDEFYGPAPFELVDFEGDGYPVDDDGGLDINALICAIDFYVIAERVEDSLINNNNEGV
jgi:hypothetical protein